MTIAEQMKAVAAALEDWAAGAKGSVDIASDAVHVIDLIRSKPGGPMTAVLFNTEDPRGDHDELGKVDRGFKVVVSRGRGFKVQTGESLTEGVAGGKPMFDLVEEVREVVRCMRFEEEEPRPYYQGSGPFEVQGFILDAFEVRFAVGTQIPIQE